MKKKKKRRRRKGTAQKNRLLAAAAAAAFSKENDHRPPLSLSQRSLLALQSFFFKRERKSFLSWSPEIAKGEPERLKGTRIGAVESRQKTAVVAIVDRARLTSTSTPSLFQKTKNTGGCRRHRSRGPRSCPRRCRRPGLRLRLHLRRRLGLRRLHRRCWCRRCGGPEQRRRRCRRRRRRRG